MSVGDHVHLVSPSNEGLHVVRKNTMTAHWNWMKGMGMNQKWTNSKIKYHIKLEAGVHRIARELRTQNSTIAARDVDTEIPKTIGSKNTTHNLLIAVNQYTGILCKIVTYRSTIHVEWHASCPVINMYSDCIKRTIFPVICRQSVRTSKIDPVEISPGLIML